MPIQFFIAATISALLLLPGALPAQQPETCCPLYDKVNERTLDGVVESLDVRYEQGEAVSYLVFQHKDEFEREHGKKFSYPLVLKRDTEFEVFISTEELNEIASPTQLIELVQNRAT